MEHSDDGEETDIWEQNSPIPTRSSIKSKLKYETINQNEICIVGIFGFDNA